MAATSVVKPVYRVDLQVIVSIPQQVCAVMIALRVREDADRVCEA